jgi:uncharacterized membrane protein YgcG
VRATLWALPEAQHQAFVLRHWSGLSYEEIASVMETTPSAVESLLVRARAAVMSDHDTDDACVLVRQRLSTEQALAPTQVEHAETCRRCSQARSRLDQATGLAAAVALAPRAHVAQALAGAIPGFTAKAAMTGAAGSGAAVPGAASAGKAGLIAKGAVAAMAIAGTVGVVHTHALSWAGSARHPLQRPAPRLARPSTATHRMPPDHAAQVEPTAPVAQAGTDGTARSAHIRTDNDPRTVTDTGGSDTGTDAGGSSGSGQGADGQGSGGQDSSGGGSDAQGSNGQGSDGSGQTAGDGSGSSSSGDTSSQDQNSGDTAGGDTQQNNGSQQQS